MMFLAKLPRQQMNFSSFHTGGANTGNSRQLFVNVIIVVVFEL